VTETKFTPGPWFAVNEDNENDDGAAVDAHCNIASSPVPTMQARFIARVWADGPSPAGDAALLAAAPSLYEALASIVDVMDRLGGVQSERMVRARAALARARGETP
jgi:hypothetical protein